MKLWREGDRSSAACEACGKTVATRFERRGYAPIPGGPEVPGVLVAACEACGGVLAIPYQSVPRIRPAIRGEADRVEVRLSPFLEDALGLVALKHRARPEEFGPALFRLYVRRAAEDAGVARRLGELSRSDLARGAEKATARLSLRLPREPWAATLAGSGLSGRSAVPSLVRGIVTAAAIDSGLAEAEGSPADPEFARSIESVGLALGEGPSPESRAIRESVAALAAATRSRKSGKGSKAG